jgi:hypothetical protein
MKTGERYYNCSRADQIVELLEVNASTVVYKVTQGNYYNPLKIFKCTIRRFNNLYIKLGRNKKIIN